MSKSNIALEFTPSQGKTEDWRIPLIIEYDAVEDKSVAYYYLGRNKKAEASSAHDITNREFLKSHRVQIEGVRFFLLSIDSTPVDVDIDIVGNALCLRYGRLSRVQG